MSTEADLELVSGRAFSPQCWSSYAVFRESFLSVHLTDRDAAALRIVGRLLYDALLASTDDQREEAGDDITVLELKGVLLDLWQLEGHLESVGDWLDIGHSGPGALHLCKEARRASGEVRRIAARLRKEMATTPVAGLPRRRRAADAS